ncbi:30S ribosomal protein S16 [Candidatus Peribacteria bacterium]|nr:30S ribosomal protein S16 [Candidatus Peribacteria bacterium]
MLVIRLARQGRKKQPFYHIVCAEKARATQKQFIEKLGYYDPLAEGGKGALEYNAERVNYRVSTGAQMSDTVARLLAKDGVEAAKAFVPQRRATA